MKKTAEKYLQQLCYAAPHRCVGSPGNRLATDFVSGVFASFGFEVSQPQFDCIDWHAGELTLSAAAESFEAHISPYSLGCRVAAPLRTADTLAELQALDCAGDLLLLSGDLTREQLIPKNFSFYNPEHHQQLIRLLEEKQPAAILAATTSDPGVAGGISPFPLIEDGDFDIPSVYMTADEGQRLAQYVGQPVSLQVEARRLPAEGVNVIGRRGRDPKRRLVVCAHVDGKLGTPAAIDNAAGVVVLLLLAELLQDYKGERVVELLAVNGEDHYAAAGELLYIRENEGKFQQVELMINIDAAGYIEGQSAFSFYGLSAENEGKTRQVFLEYPGLVEGEQWYQSDHSVFIQQGVPAIAFTSQQFMYLTSEVTHTLRDQAEIVELEKLVEIAHAIRKLITELS